MSYLPEMPGVPAQMSYGQGFGNWQKYAGFNAQKPFGSMPVQQQTPASSVPPVVNATPIPVQPNTPMGQFGSLPTTSMGTTSEGQFGSIEDAVAADEHKY